MRSSCACLAHAGGRGREGQPSPLLESVCLPSVPGSHSSPAYKRTSLSLLMDSLPALSSGPFPLAPFGFPAQRSCLGRGWDSPSACKPMARTLSQLPLLTTPFTSAPYCQVKESEVPLVLPCFFIHSSFLCFSLSLSAS